MYVLNVSKRALESETAALRSSHNEPKIGGKERYSSSTALVAALLSGPYVVGSHRILIIVLGVLPFDGDGTGVYAQQNIARSRVYKNGGLAIFQLTEAVRVVAEVQTAVL